MEKYLNKFLSIFVFLFIIQFCIKNNRALPFNGIINNLIWEPLSKLLPFDLMNKLFFKSVIFNSESPFGGSGDTTSEFIIFFAIILTSIICTIFLFTIPKIREIKFEVLNYLILRYYLAFIMIYYGFAKMFSLQFSQFDLLTLTTTYGESSPMELAWAYFGYSHSYQFFIGFLEVLSFFLLFRRTATFGALITLVMTINIVAVNYFFDIPVKLFSSILLFFTIGLLSKDLKTIFMFFFSGNYVSLKTKPYNFADTNRMPKYLVAIKTVLIVFYFFSTISALSSKKFKFDAISKIQPTMYGSYTILKQNFDSLINANQVDNNWKQLIIENEGFATVKYNCDITLNYVTSFDSISKSLIFYDEMMNIKYAYLISIIDTNSYILKGQDTFIITKQIVSNNIKLKHFHWINDNTNNK